MTRTSKLVWLTVAVSPVWAGCFIEQPGMNTPAYPSSGNQASGQQNGVPSPATATVVTGDAALDPGALAAAVTGTVGELGRCFVGSGQVDLVVSLDTAGQVSAVEGPGEAACLLPALRTGPYPRPTVATQFRVSLWIEARAAAGQGVSTAAQQGTQGATPAGAPGAWRRDVFLVTIGGVRIDPARPDGRAWDEGAGTAPAADLFVKLVRNDLEVIRTETVPDNATPSFGDARARSLRLGAADVIRFEIWDDDPGAPELVARFEVPPPTPEHLVQGLWEIGPSPPMQLLSIRLGAPRSMIGTGIRWEARGGSLHVLEVALDSPAAQAGVEAGDRIVTVDGQRVRGLATSVLEGMFRGAEGSQMRVEVEHRGQRRTVELARAVVFY